MKFKYKSKKTKVEFKLEAIDYVVFYEIINDLILFINGLIYKKKLKLESL